MTYRDEYESALERAEALERELSETKGKLSEEAKGKLSEAERVLTLERKLSEAREKLAAAREASKGSAGKRSTSSPRRPSADATDTGKKAKRSAGMTVMVVIFFFWGATCGGGALKSALSTGSDLASGVRTRAVATDKEWKHARVPVIEVDGKRYRCSGDSGNVKVGVAVRYERGNPENCRLEVDVGKISSGQWGGIGAGTAGFLFFIIYGIRLWRSSA